MRHLALFSFLLLSACGSDSGGEGPACPLTGRWVGSAPASSTFIGSSLTLDFADDGTGHFRLGSNSGSPYQTDTTWSLDGNTLTIEDDERAGLLYGCDPGEVGRFELHFADDCSAVQLEVIDDACPQRGDVLHDAALSAQ